MGQDDEDSAFSRGQPHGEKLTVISPMTIRQTESWSKKVGLLAGFHGMEKAEYIRHLVDKDELEQKKIWADRSQLFSDSSGPATDKAYVRGIRS
jgi:hypothetical protein